MTVYYQSAGNGARFLSAKRLTEKMGLVSRLTGGYRRRQGHPETAVCDCPLLPPFNSLVEIKSTLLLYCEMNTHSEVYI